MPVHSGSSIPPKQQDKEWAITDFTHGPRGNWIYVAWTEFDNYGSKIHQTAQGFYLLAPQMAVHLLQV